MSQVLQHRSTRKSSVGQGTRDLDSLLLLTDSAAHLGRLLRLHLRFALQIWNDGIHLEFPAELAEWE
jgi:hypothetical protein